MGESTIIIGSVVLVAFPFSNLKGQKIRPALVLANVEFGDIILCQITSKPYASKTAICIKSTDFLAGNLPIISYVRPDKLFTADSSIIREVIGTLTPGARKKILQNVRKLFKNS